MFNQVCDAFAFFSPLTLCIFAAGRCRGKGIGAHGQPQAVAPWRLSSHTVRAHGRIWVSVDSGVLLGSSPRFLE